MRLENGDRFPAVAGPTVEGDTLHVPDDLADRWTVLLFYRGRW